MKINDFEPNKFISLEEMNKLKKGYIYQLFILEDGNDLKIYKVKYKEIDLFYFHNFEIINCPEEPIVIVVAGQGEYKNYWWLRYCS